MENSILNNCNNINQLVITKTGWFRKQKNRYLYQLAFIIILIPYFKPVGVAAFPLINKLFQCGKVCALLISVAYILNNFKLKSAFFLKGVLALVFFESIYVINSAMNGTNYSNILNNSVTNIILLFLIYFALMGNNRNAFLNAIDTLFSIELFLHILSFVVAHMGYAVFDVNPVDEYTYLFGRDNYSAFAVLPMLGIVIYIDTIKTTKTNKILMLLKDYALIVSLLLCYVRVKSATASMVLALFLLGYMFKRISGKILLHFNVKRMFFFIIVFLVAVIIYNAPAYLAHILSVVFNKGQSGITLNSRTIIWNMALNLIKQRPIWGWGVLSQYQIENYVLYGTEHAHNIVLELLLRVGIMGFCCYVFFLIAACKNYKKIIKSNEIILIITLQCFLLLSIMDTYLLMQQQYCLMGFIYYYGSKNAYNS